VTDTAPSYALVTDLAELELLCARLAADRKPIGFDEETSYRGPDREKGAVKAEINYIVSAQLTNSPDWARMIPLAFDSGLNLDNRKAAALLWALFQVTDDEGLPLAVAHNAFAELRWSARWFLANLWDHPLFARQVIAARGYFPLRSDTVLESYVLAKYPRHGIKNITLWEYGHQMAEIESLFEGLTQKQLGCLRFSVLDQRDPKVISYACEDAVWCLRWHLDHWPALRRDKIFQLEMSVLPVVCDMADEGLEMDWAYIREGARQACEFEQLMLAEIIEEFNELLAAKGRDPLPPDFNWNSPPQKARLFYEWLELPVVHETDGGKSGKKKPSTDAKNAIPKLARLCEPIAQYARWMKLNTLRTHFLDIYEDNYSWAADGRAHPSLIQFGTIAGRFSCEDFNYQQSPGDFKCELRDGSTFEFSFRKAIIAPRPGLLPWWSMVLEDAGAPPELYLPDDWDPEAGWYLIGFDYSQIELRVMASQAGCTRLIEDYEAGADVHRRTAALMLGIPEDQVSKAERAKGKIRNFANIYGQGKKALADQLGIPLKEADLKDAQYRALYPELKPYRYKVIREARRDGYLITHFGRKVTIHEYKDPNPNIQFKGDMTAGNAVVQGPATGDYPKAVMIRATRAIRRAGLEGKIKLVMNVHDSLTFAVRKDVTPAQVVNLLQNEVVFPVKGWLPMVAEWYMGRSWGEQKDLEITGEPPNCRVRLKRKGAPAPVVASPHGVAADAVDRGPVPARPAAGYPQAAVADDDSGPAPHDGEPGPAGRKVVITVKDVPGSAEAQRLMALLRSLPGSSVVTLVTDEGALQIRGASGLTPAHEARVATVLGQGALVSYDLDSADAEAMSRGLRL
jgi:DNA polymerase I-like protein with 3'-5' exonuclease and polymerase domains